MTIQDLQQQPAFQALAKPKQQFLLRFVQNTSSSFQFQQFLAALGAAKSQGISFDPKEQDLLIQVLSFHLSKEDQLRLQQLLLLLSPSTRT